MPAKLRPIRVALVMLTIMALPATHRSSGEAADSATSLAPQPLPASQVPELCRGESTREGWWGPMEYQGRMYTQVLLAFDTSASMSAFIADVQAHAEPLVDALRDIALGVGVIAFRDYPINPYGEPGDRAYQIVQPITGQREQVLAAIQSLSAGGGGYAPQAYTRALYEAYADWDIGWDHASRKFLIVFGNSVSHDDDLNAGVSAPPYLPDGVWQSGHPPSYLDPGRDGVPGTADDLDYQATLAELASTQVREFGQDHEGRRFITVLFVLAPDTPLPLEEEDLETYWSQWADVAGADGEAITATDAAALPERLAALIEARQRHANAHSHGYRDTDSDSHTHGHSHADDYPHAGPALRLPAGPAPQRLLDRPAGQPQHHPPDAQRHRPRHHPQRCRRLCRPLLIVVAGAPRNLRQLPGRGRIAGGGPLRMRHGAGVRHHRRRAVRRRDLPVHGAGAGAGHAAECGPMAAGMGGLGGCGLQRCGGVDRTGVRRWRAAVPPAGAGITHTDPNRHPHNHGGMGRLPAADP